MRRGRVGSGIVLAVVFVYVHALGGDGWYQ